MNCKIIKNNFKNHRLENQKLKMQNYMNNVVNFNNNY